MRAPLSSPSSQTTSLPRAGHCDYRTLWHALLNGEYDTYTQSMRASSDMEPRLAMSAIKLRGNARWLFRRSPRFEQTIFVKARRVEDADAFERFEGPGDMCVVSGPPVKGKSSFLNYLLLRYARRRRKVVVHSSVDHRIVSFCVDGTVHVEDDFDYVHGSKVLDDDVHIFLGNYLETGVPLTSYIAHDNCASVSFVPLGAYLDDVNAIRRIAHVSLGDALMWTPDELCYAGMFADPPMDESLCRSLYESCLRNDLREFFER